jgi:hypothetical protein
MSRKTFNEVTQLLDDVRKKILVSALEDEKVDDVYVVNIQAFPITRSGRKIPASAKELQRSTVHV